MSKKHTTGKLLLEILLVTTLMMGSLAVRNGAFAQSVPNPDAPPADSGGQTQQEEQPFIILPGAEKFGLENFAIDGGRSGTEQARGLVYRIAFLARTLIGALAIFFLVYSGFRLVTAGGNDDVMTLQKRNIVWSLAGLAIIGLSGEFAVIFEGGDIIKGPNVLIRKIHFFDQKTQLVITFVKYILGSVAVIQMATAGLRMITGGEKEETVTKSKKNFVYGGIGLLIVFIANTVVNRVFYRVDKGRYLRGGVEPSLSVSEGVKEIVGITNIIVTIATPIAILAIIAGAVMYLTSMGEEDKMTRARKIIFNALIALIVIYGAFALVTTVISGNVAGLSGAGEATAN